MLTPHCFPIFIVVAHVRSLTQLHIRRVTCSKSDTRTEVITYRETHFATILNYCVPERLILEKARVNREKMAAVRHVSDVEDPQAGYVESKDIADDLSDTMVELQDKYVKPGIYFTIPFLQAANESRKRTDNGVVQVSEACSSPSMLFSVHSSSDWVAFSSDTVRQPASTVNCKESL